MPRNGSGTMTVPNSFTPNTTILSSAVNANFTDFATEVTNSLPRDGQAAMTGRLGIIDGTEALPGIRFSGDTNTGFRRSADDTIEWVAGGADRMFIDSAGKAWFLGALDAAGLLTAALQIVAGHSAALALTSPGAFTPAGQAIGAAGAAQLVARFSADANQPRLVLAKSRHATLGSHTVVQSGDVLGEVLAQGSDGDSFELAAAIQAIVDGTPGAADMPGALLLMTSADGAATPTERMAVRADGKVQIPNRSAPLIQFDPSGFTDLTEISAPAAPAANNARLYAKDDGGETLLAYLRSDGSLATLVPAASQAEMEAAASLTRMVLAGRQHFHPGHPKAGGNFDGSGTPAFRCGDYGMGAITDKAAGIYTLALDTAFADTNYWVNGFVRIYPAADNAVILTAPNGGTQKRRVPSRSTPVTLGDNRRGDAAEAASTSGATMPKGAP